MASTKKRNVSKETPTQAAPEIGAAALDDIFQSVNRSDAPGLIVAVAQHGRLLYRRGFGLACVQQGVANTAHTRMRIGSTTKHFACLAALLLAEEGKLDIDAPATGYLPELPKLGAVPTLRQFMQHTSGYRDYLDLAFVSNGMTMMPVGSALAAQVRQTEVNFAPGAGQLYCNGAYHLLSLAIERAAKMPLLQWLKERIFDPLGMYDTELVQSDALIVPGLATLHVPAPNGGWRRGTLPTEQNLGEGGLVSSLDDMLIWLKHLRGPHSVGTEDTWRQMVEVATLNSGLVTTYALGLWRHNYRGVEVIHHGGSVIGGTSQMLTVPSHALDIAIMVNGASVSPVALAFKVVDTLLGDKVLGKAPKMASSAPYKHLVGSRYHAPSGMVIGFGDVDGKLGLSMLHSPPAPMLRDEGETLRIGFEDIGMGPMVLRVADLAPGADGQAPPTLMFGESGNVERFTRLPGVTPAAGKVGAALVGRYRSHDLAADAQIAFDGDSLVLRFFSQNGVRDMTLEALSATVFGVVARDELAPARNALTVERKGKQVTGFRFNSGRTRKLWFERLPEPYRPLQP